MLGAGSKVVATQKAFTQGNLQTTDNALDISIQGRGFFEILQPDGTLAYTRNGQFTLNEDGEMVTPGAGYQLQPVIAVPEDAQQITILRMVKCRPPFVVRLSLWYWVS